MISIGGVNLLDEILVIRESLPIFYYNRDPSIALNEDWYLLQSGFFVALSSFANEMSKDRLKYIVLENKLYALDEVSEVLVIFGNNEKMSQEIITKLQGDLSKATTYLNQLFNKYNLQPQLASYDKIDDIGKDFGTYLKNEKLVEDDTPFDPLKSRSLMQKFIFKSIGYKPGQCNIGKAERLKRLMSGFGGLVLAIIGFLLIFFLEANAFYTLILIIPIFLGFQGFYQYFFKFCVVNGLSKRFDMR
ncbi:MAG: hypothetical protein JXA54_02200 [Candidatus Heimdallarchaeota archaeon]|nr:hypothetical protein [Candidatus Heimdallarchaeota archaeon]